MILISVVIPVLNGENTLQRCLESIRQQTFGYSIEILVLDSGSKDHSCEIAASFGARIIKIDPKMFNHGLTRNIGVEQAKGELIFFTVQDAWLHESDMLQRMSRHFDDLAIMGVVGHQAVPHEKDKNPLLWFRRIAQPQVQYRRLQQSDDYERLTALQKKELIAWDNVVAMYRKSALQDLPFSKTGFAEDWIWSRDAILKGYTLVYDPSLVVYHYHHLSYDYAYRVQFTVNYHIYKYFGLLPSNPRLIYPVIRAGYHLIKNKTLGWCEKLYWFNYNIKANLALYKSYRHFIFVLQNKGMLGVEMEHKRICAEIPQGKQKIKT